MTEIYAFENEDSGDQKAEEEEQITLFFSQTQRQIMCNFTSPSVSQGNKDQRELELGERMSNEAVDINAEEYKKVNDTAHRLGHKGSK